MAADHTAALLRVPQVTDRQGTLHEAIDCKVIGIARLNDGKFRLRCVRPGTGDEFPTFEVIIDALGRLQPQAEGVFALW